MKGAVTKGDAMAKPMAVEDCQAHMAMSKKDAKKGDAMVKKDPPVPT